MRPLRPRRVLASLLLTLVTVLALGLTGSAVAVAEPTARPGQPVARALLGTWDGSVDTGQEVVDAQLVFRRGGVVCLVSFSGPDGGVEGSGRWHPAGRDRFTFTLTERFFDGDGNTTFTLRIRQTGTLTSTDAWSSEGTATFFDADGGETGSGSSAVTATRASDKPIAC